MMDTEPPWIGNYLPREKKRQRTRLVVAIGGRHLWELMADDLVRAGISLAKIISRDQPKPGVLRQS